jgi:5-methylcytosine-specific restriction endonuclease McrA
MEAVNLKMYNDLEKKRIYNREWMRRYRQENRKEEAEYQHAYYERNRERIAERRHADYLVNIEERRKRDCELRAANKEQRNARQRARYAANKEEAAKAAREWRHNHPEQCRKNYQNWYIKNIGKCRMYWHNRRARINGNGGELPADVEERLFKSQEGRCYLCGELFYTTFDDPATIEHKIPLSRGGANDLANVALAHLSCNARKGTKTHEEFLGES